MEDEADLLDLDQLEEPVSSDGDSEGSESEASEVEPEPAAVGHGYNLRPKRAAARAEAASGRYKKDVIAPGEGVVANHNMSAGATSGSRVDPTERVSGPKALTPDDPKRERRSAGRAVYLAIRRSLIRMVVCPAFGTRGWERH